MAHRGGYSIKFVACVLSKRPVVPIIGERIIIVVATTVSDGEHDRVVRRALVPRVEWAVARSLPVVLKSRSRRRRWHGVRS